MLASLEISSQQLQLHLCPILILPATFRSITTRRNNLKEDRLGSTVLQIKSVNWSESHFGGGGEQIERNSSQLEVLFITQMDAKVLGNLVITVWLVQLALLFNKIGCYLVTPIHYKNLCFCL